MLGLISNRRGQPAPGFSLVELMVGMAVGLILLTAMVALVMAVLRANADVLASAKLNQEGRAIGDIIHRELKRARYNGDNLAAVGLKGAWVNPFGPVTGQDATVVPINDDCIKFSYDSDDNGSLLDPANPTPPPEVKSFFLQDGAVYYSQKDTYAQALCAVGTGAMRLSSPDVEVTELRFVQMPDDTTTAGINEQDKNHLMVTFTLALTRQDGDDTGVTRQFDQTIQLRNPFLD